MTDTAETTEFAFTEAPEDMEVLTGAGREPKFGKTFATLTASWDAETPLPSKWLLFPDDATDVSLRNSAKWAGWVIELGKSKSGQRLFRVKERFVAPPSIEEQNGHVDEVARKVAARDAARKGAGQKAG
jgi:hypothetical protein